MKVLRLFGIGFFMGVADLIPGISGSTIALISGIYYSWIESIKTLQFQSIKNISWKFLLPLGVGVSSAILFFSPILYFLLKNYPCPLKALFFGLIAASSVVCMRQIPLKKSSFFWFFGGLIGAYLLSQFCSTIFICSNLGSIFVASILTAFAVLLPGISGSYFLQMLGIYPLALSALSHPFEWDSFKLLATIGLGIALGMIVFSRLVSILLRKARFTMLSLLVGCMIGGMRTLWPFESQQILVSLSFILLGFLFVFLLEMKSKKNSIKT